MQPFSLIFRKYVVDKSYFQWARLVFISEQLYWAPHIESHSPLPIFRLSRSSTLPHLFQQHTRLRHTRFYHAFTCAAPSLLRPTLAIALYDPYCHFFVFRRALRAASSSQPISSHRSASLVASRPPLPRSLSNRITLAPGAPYSLSIPCCLLKAASVPVLPNISFFRRWSSRYQYVPAGDLLLLSLIQLRWYIIHHLRWTPAFAALPRCS